MMYNSGLVAVVKCNGKILREDKDLVYLPFNSEYSILLKNLDSTRKCLVKISIDGNDVLENHSLIIYPNNISEIEGFLSGNSIKNKFKFIKKTKEISDYRGDKIDDGIIRIEYWFEEYIPVDTSFLYNYFTNDSFRCQPNFIKSSEYNTNSLKNYSSEYNTNSLKNYSSNINTYGSCISVFCNYNDGITVKGTETDQKIRYDNIGKLEYQSKVIILKLIGIKNSGIIVEKPITIKTKKICSSCGRKSKSHIKYCPNCGTFME